MWTNQKTCVILRSGQLISIIDTSSYTVIKTISGLAAGPWYMAMSQTGDRLYVASHSTTPDGAVTVIEVATNMVLKQIPVADATDMVLTPDGSHLYVVRSNSSNAVAIIDTSSESVTSTIPLPSHGFDIAINPAGNRIYVTDSASDTVSVIDTSSNAVVKTISIGAFSAGIAVGPNGTHAYVASVGSVVSIIDLGSNSLIGTITVGSAPQAVLAET